MDPTVPGDMNRACGQHKYALRDLHGPRAIAEPSARGALAIAARLLMSGATSIAIMRVHARNTS